MLCAPQERRRAYDASVANEAAMEDRWSELATLLTRLKEKLDEAANTIRCTNCSRRHRRWGSVKNASSIINANSYQILYFFPFPSPTDRSLLPSERSSPSPCTPRGTAPSATYGTQRERCVGVLRLEGCMGYARCCLAGEAPETLR